MMKKILSLSFAIILCGTVSVAQISHDDYNKWLNYRTCKYTVEYLKCVNYTSIPDTLNSVSFDNALDINALYTLSKGYEFSQTYNALSKEYYENRRNKWNKNISNEDVKKTLELKNFTRFSTLKETTKNLDKDFDTYLAGNTEKQNSAVLKRDNDCNPKEIKFLKDTISLCIGDTIQVTYTVTPPCSKNVTLDWPKGAKIVKFLGDEGKITALKEGRVDITVTINGTEINDTCTVVVKKEESTKTTILIIAGIIALIVSLFVRVKYWEIIKYRKLEKIFYGVVVLLLLILLFIWDPWKIGIALLLVVVAAFYYLKKHKKNPISNAETIDDDSQIANKKYKELENEFNKFKNRFKQLEEDYKKLQESYDTVLQERNELERKCKTLEKKQEIAGLPHNDEKHPAVPYIKGPVVEKVASQNISYLYADAIINDVFNKVSEQPNEDTVYELRRTTPSDRSAKFIIYKGAYSRVIDTPDFIKGCEKQVTGKNDLQVDPGEAAQNDLGKWKITKKARIKFI
jgi:hypothetical protein